MLISDTNISQCCHPELDSGSSRMWLQITNLIHVYKRFNRYDSKPSWHWLPTHCIIGSPIGVGDNTKVVIVIINLIDTSKRHQHLIIKSFRESVGFN